MRVYEERVIALLLLLDAEMDVHELPKNWDGAERGELVRLAMWAADEETLAWAYCARKAPLLEDVRREWFVRAVNWEYRRSVFRAALDDSSPEATNDDEGKQAPDGQRPYYELLRRDGRQRPAA